MTYITPKLKKNIESTHLIYGNPAFTNNERIHMAEDWQAWRGGHTLG